MAFKMVQAFDKLNGTKMEVFMLKKYLKRNKISADILKFENINSEVYLKDRIF